LLFGNTSSERLNCGDVSLAPDPGKVYGIPAIELAADIIGDKSSFASWPCSIAKTRILRLTGQGQDG
jgi:hypothetical protein